MKRAAIVFLAAGALLLSGCTTVRCWFVKGECLTYEQYLSIDQSANPAPTADQVLKTLGNPLAVRDRDGVRRRVDYYAFSLNGDLKIAEFTFDANEKLVKKELW
jgi:outer membrane protein assembly factor BamE (lipoprotein component of BamABCDE complex)